MLPPHAEQLIAKKEIQDLDAKLEKMRIELMNSNTTEARLGFVNEEIDRLLAARVSQMRIRDK